MGRGRQVNAELDDEFRFHIASRAEELMRQGMTAEEAEEQAKRLFGNALVLRDTMAQIVGERLAPDRFNILLYGGLAALALFLSTLGIYGVMAFTVVQRTAEIGLRMALGAGHNQVRRQILRQGATLATGGLVLGLVGAYALGRTMQSMPRPATHSLRFVANANPMVTFTPPS